MGFQIQGAVFKQSDEDNQKRFKDSWSSDKKYPSVRGQINIRVDELLALVKYLKAAAILRDLRTAKFSYYDKDLGKTVVQEHLAVPLEINGYIGKTNDNVQMVSLKVDPHFAVQKQILEAEKDQSSVGMQEPAVAPKDDFFSDD